ncbi:MAG TPA: MarR family transcriptional regulator [Thermomicrobiales bacterium]|jgi:DNA-binding MarR family transcriptional regulator
MAISEADHAADGTDHGLGTLLRMPYQAMMAEGVEPALAAAGHGAVRGAHLPVIQALATHPAGLRATALAAYARITKQSMGYLVDHLEAGGYVERAPDPVDQRAKVVRLTPRGWAASRTIRAAVGEVEADWGRRVGAARMEQLRAILRDLVASLDR